MKKVSGTDLIHGDAAVQGGKEVVPSISVTTTYCMPEPTVENFGPVDADPRNPAIHIYSRYTQEVSTRAEHILSRINEGYALTYSSGLAATYAALVFYSPKRIAITGGYFGSHGTIQVYKKTKGVDFKVIDLDDEYLPGDLCWLETPLNPTGESRDIRYYADKIHKVGGKLIVDSTFAPPPLQYPFNFGADCIMHSGTKYIGGHSDLLGGILVVKTIEEWNTLYGDRIYMGNTMGSLDSWLLLRSLRTLHLRVSRHSTSATEIVQWLNAVASTPKGQSYDGIPGGLISRIWHSSLQGKDARGFDPKQQMQGGWNATFAIQLTELDHAARLPHLLRYFFAATSLGGVISLAEHRINNDPGADPRIVRLSIGVEEAEDLKQDLRQALQKLTKIEAKL